MSEVMEPCVVCMGEPYAGADGFAHTDVCPACGACSGLYGGEPVEEELEPEPVEV